MNTDIQLLNLSSMLPETQAVPFVIDKKSSRDFVLWGENNKLPQYLWDTYISCSDLQSCVNRCADYFGTANVSKPEYLLTDDDDWAELIQKCIFDYILFGGFALEGIRNKMGDLVRLNYINIMNVRVDEELETAFISNKWGTWQGKDMVKLPLWTKGSLDNHFIYMYRGAITRNIYPVPIWFSSLKSAQTLNETRNFNLRNIQNNFAANVIISLNGTSIKTRELEEIKEKLEASYTGTENAGKSMLINNTNTDGKVEVMRLDSDKAADIYSSVQDSAKSDMYVAFGINPMLLGVNQNTGFNTDEFQNSYKLYSATIINPLQNNVIKAFSKLGVSVSFDEFKIDWEA